MSDSNAKEPTGDWRRAANASSSAAGRVLVVDDMPGNVKLARSVQPSTRLIPVVLVAALHQSEDRIHGFEMGADDFLTKPINAPELGARVRSLIKIKRYTDDLDSAESVIISMALTIEARDPSTDGHCQRLAAYATALGIELGLTQDDLAALQRGGFLHDIGKVGVPDSLLLKPGRLTSEEYEQIKMHTVIGELMGMVDVFDALTTPRPYKKALPLQAACDELRCEADRGWRSRELVDVFVRLCSEGRLPRVKIAGPRTNG